MTQTQDEAAGLLARDGGLGAVARARDEVTTDGAVRTRTYSWTDPAATFEALAGRSGLELLSAMGRGELPPPPVMATLGIEPVEFTEGLVRFALDPQEMHYNPLGTVHGGVLATLLDSATGCAVHSVLPEGTGYTTLDLNARYLRPVTTDTGRIVVTGTVVSRGSRTALAEARLTDSRDRLLAHATSTCLLFSTRP
ncbi:MAG TPA: PaaI family thioesterase [Streptosporangiaceae bacterium]|jgi:uncharacterized protein (TIGR00369 family)|nr:PaaI family thioesterase [Streptosporangiaceae bacterium]